MPQGVEHYYAGSLPRGTTRLVLCGKAYHTLTCSYLRCRKALSTSSYPNGCYT